MPAEKEPATPEDLAATFDQTAVWMATRPAGVTSTGDGLDGTVAGLRDAAKGIREHLVPAFDDLRDRLRAAEADRDHYRRERDAIRDRAAAYVTQVAGGGVPGCLRDDAAAVERDSLRRQLTALRAEAEAAAASLVTEAAGQRGRHPMLGTRLDRIARRLVTAADASGTGGAS